MDRFSKTMGKRGGSCIPLREDRSFAISSSPRLHSFSVWFRWVPLKPVTRGGEPILTSSGGVLTDDHGHRPYVTTAGSAFAAAFSVVPARWHAVSEAAATTMTRAALADSQFPAVPLSSGRSQWCCPYMTLGVLV